MSGPYAAADSLPFVAPCRLVAAGAPLRWIRLGWRDLTAAPLESLSFGAGICALSALVCGVALRFGTGWLVLVLLSGFVFVAPVLTIGPYTISAALERGARPSLGKSFAATRRHHGDALNYSLILMVICLYWYAPAAWWKYFFRRRPLLRASLLRPSSRSAVRSEVCLRSWCSLRAHSRCRCSSIGAPMR